MKIFKLSIVVLLVCGVFACRDDRQDSNGTQFEKLFLKTFNEPIAIVDISDDGEHFLAGSWIDKVRCWSKSNFNSVVAEASFESELTALQFVNGNKQIFLANGMGMTRLFDYELEHVVYEYIFSKPARYSAVSDDGGLIAYGEEMLQTEQNTLVPSISSHAGQSSLQISKQKHVLTSGYHDAGVVVRDADGKTIAKWKVKDSVQATAISHNGDLVVAGTEKGDCYLWSLPDKKQSHHIDGSEPVQKIHINQEGTLIVIVTETAIAGYQLNPVKEIFSQQSGGHITASFLADNNWLAIGFDNGRIKLLDIVQKQYVTELHEAKGKITSIDINISSSSMMFGSYDGYVGLYQIKN